MNARVAMTGFVLLLGSCAKGSDDAPARLLVRSATLRVLVDSLDGLEANVARQVEAVGGFTTSSELTGVGGGASLTVAFRVPSAKLDEAVRSLEAFARHVESRQLRGEDFTEEFVDLEAQRTNLTATRERLLESPAVSSTCSRPRPSRRSLRRFLRSRACLNGGRSRSRARR